jgi:hypothetical protein
MRTVLIPTVTVINTFDIKEVENAIDERGRQIKLKDTEIDQSIESRKFCDPNFMNANRYSAICKNDPVIGSLLTQLDRMQEYRNVLINLGLVTNLTKRNPIVSVGSSWTDFNDFLSAIKRLQITEEFVERLLVDVKPSIFAEWKNEPFKSTLYGAFAEQYERLNQGNVNEQWINLMSIVKTIVDQTQRQMFDRQ